MAYGYLEMAEEVLKEVKKPMTIREILNFAGEKGYFEKMESVGKTPEKTMNASLHRNMKKGEMSRFKQVSNKPALFDLN